jgi:phage-related protein (TIGR01555 family)
MMKLDKAWRLKAWAKRMLGADAASEVFGSPKLPDGVGPGAEVMAQDSVELGATYAYANSAGCYQGFPGYPALAALAQLPEYRMLSEKLSQAMVRKWIKITSKSDDKDNADRISAIEDALIRHKVRELFRDCATNDGFFGRCHLFIDVGQDQGDELSKPLLMDNKKIGVGMLRGFKLVEPMYTYPFEYDTANPLSVKFYTPQSWYVMAQRVHRSRLLDFVSRPVPNILKPAYNFGGMSMSQLAQPYVDNWLKTRTSVGRLISNFSIVGVATQMGNMLIGVGDDATGDGEDLIARSDLFIGQRDNQGLMMIDKDTEEMFNLTTPLTTLDALQAQSQEHMSSVSSTPLSILLGITPTGLNASTDGEIRTYYDHVLSMQGILFNDNLTTVINVIQLDLDGVIDPDITHEFVPLWQQDATELATNRKTDAETAQIYAGVLGAISADEVREKLARDPESGFTGLSGQAIGPAPDPADETDDDADA